MTSDDDQEPGVACCHGCEGNVLFARFTPGASEVVYALDPDERGPIAAWEDDTGTARCRHVGAGEQLRLGEYLFRFHDPSCPALARPIPLTGRARPCPEPERRRANA